MKMIITTKKSKSNKFILSLMIILFSSVPTLAGLEDYDYYRAKLPAIQKSQNKELMKNLYFAISNNKPLDYKEARKYLFGQLFLQKRQGHYFIKDAYCQKTYVESMGVGPGKIPVAKFINCEHTWPQSRFNSNEDRFTQKGDLHHLFPVDSRSNSSRSNIDFGDVNGEPLTNCPRSKRGDDLNTNSTSFEPPKEHKGNVARALFYFSVRYRISIDDIEEAYLKEWNRVDPVDQAEKSRHEQIYQIQGNRNPFIDDSTLADQIDNF